jgi:hypothetical protein
MKAAICLLLLCFFSFHDNTPIGNARYDFADSIKAGSGNFSINMDELSVAGHAREAAMYEDSLLGRKPDILVNLKEDKIVDARQYIPDRADKYRVILINESHGRPEHRLFTKSSVIFLKMWNRELCITSLQHSWQIIPVCLRHTILMS